ncbi:cytochrome P450 [Crucibulum laeve]|uniref:Cytochrome P450 n=1 Tax=Crucibulum laeve TaxID=68775 RepID=A0A5C3M7V2_9AGAR|nr:cytochrome P450 [Crucibulum laeve]
MPYSLPKLELYRDIRLLLPWPSARSVVILLASLFIAYFLNLYRYFRLAVLSINDFPGGRTVFSVELILNRFFGSIPGVLLSADYSWTERYDPYEKARWDIHSTIAAWPRGSTSLWLADADAIKEVTSSRVRFPKPVDMYAVLKVFGPNIVGSEFDEWKKFRRITAPAFSERNNKYVWDATVRVMMNVFENSWGWRDEITVDHATELTLPIALSVLAVAGFGSPIDFIEEKDEAPLRPGHDMSFKQALHIVAKDIWIKLVLPEWAYGLYPRFRRMRKAFAEVELYMREMIYERRTLGKTEDRFDLFGLLLDGNDNPGVDENVTLTDDELLGNLFIFLLGGHEASAHTLCFTFAALALYQEEQEILYQQILKVLPSDKTPSYEDMHSLTQSMAVFNETLRMFSPVNVIPKYSAEDTILTASSANGDQMQIPVPKGTKLFIHTPGLHYNPRYWPEPETFKPGRFLGDWPRDAFMAYSAGSRGCMGRKFFETEGVAVLTLIVKYYKITVKDEPQFASETFGERKARIFNARNILTLTPNRVPLSFSRRR